jgi:hypothetical protein
MEVLNFANIKWVFMLKNRLRSGCGRPESIKQWLVVLLCHFEVLKKVTSTIFFL